MPEPISVVYVEDSATQREIMSAAMRHMPTLQMKIVETLKEGLEEAQHRDVVLLDLHLPEIDNPLDGLKAMIQQHPDTPVVVFTSDTTLAEEALMLGATDYVVKDLSPWAMLAQALKNAVMRRRASKSLLGYIKDLEAEVPASNSQKLATITDRMKRLVVGH